MEGVKPSMVSTHFKLPDVSDSDQIPTSQAKLLPPSAPWQKILAQEKQLAQEYFTAKGVENVEGYAVNDPLPKPGPHLERTQTQTVHSANEVVRQAKLVQSADQLQSLPVAQPVNESSNKTDTDVAKITETNKELPVLISWKEEVPIKRATAVESSQNTFEAIPIAKAEPVQTVSSLSLSSSAFPVEDIAKQKGFLRKADVKFDEGNKVWTAKWWKPKMFHFGMVLYPALKDYLETGASYSFVSRGVESTITKAKDELFLERGKNRMKIGSQELYGLLRGKISVDGYDLGLDRKGNLIMQAEGAKAMLMASLKR